MLELEVVLMRPATPSATELGLLVLLCANELGLQVLAS